jgi:tetratricopeptide (TPR) repeat protein
VRPDVLDTLQLYVSVHELSERDRLKESRSLREDRDRVGDLLRSGADYYLFNTLSYAELSKTIYFLEKSDETKKALNQGLQILQAKLKSLSGHQERAAILGRLGELNLAAKDYSSATNFFEQAMPLESKPARLARLRANLGNAYASTGDISRAIGLYSVAENDYPEGRRSVFYSNFGYLLMLAKDFDVAERRINRALEIDPTDWYSYLNLGLVKEAQKKYDDASADFKQVIAKSENPDSRTEARILAGRCLELAGRPRAEYLALYLEADGRSTAQAQVERFGSDTKSRVALYKSMARRLQGTNTHGIEPYIDWFVARAIEEAGSP